jgi:hypothetical protein
VISRFYKICSFKFNLYRYVEDRLEYYRGDDPKNPRFAWYTDSEKLMAGIGETGKIDIKKTACKKSQPGAMVRGRNRMARMVRRHRRALLEEEDSEDSSSEVVETLDEENEAMEAKVDVAEATLEILAEQEEERATDRRRALLEEEDADSSSDEVVPEEETREEEIEQMEAKMDVAEATLEVLEEQEEERATEGEVAEGENPLALE